MSYLRISDDELETMRRAYRLADRAVVTDIETACPVVTDAGHQWYDLAPLLDTRGLSKAELDLAAETLCYGLSRQLLVMHPTQKHLVRIIKVPS